ncbi:hypothetical protein [Alteromonas gracilis]|uniref:hypothetical protein n=1 Tax=Alteromonas gracilis TaxID=1479524 RepID=UPI00321A65CE
MSIVYVTSIDITDKNKVVISGHTAYGGTEVFVSFMVYIDKPANGIYDYAITYKMAPFVPAMLTPFSVYAEMPEEDANGVRILFPQDHEPIEEVVLMKVGVIEKYSDSTFNMVTPVGASIDEQSGHLIVDLQYSGGCLQHDFEVECDGKMRKSNPPQYIISIVDTSPRDDCEMLVQTQLIIDINNSDFKPEPGAIMNVTTPSFGASIPVKVPY